MQLKKEPERNDGSITVGDYYDCIALCQRKMPVLAVRAFTKGRAAFLWREKGAAIGGAGIRGPLTPPAS